MLKQLYEDTIRQLDLSEKEVYNMLKDYTNAQTEDKMEAQRSASNKRRALKNISAAAFDMMTTEVLPVASRKMTMELEMADGTVITSSHKQTIRRPSNHMKLGKTTYLVTSHGLIDIESEEYREYAIKTFIK